MAKALHIVRVQVKGENHKRIFQFDNSREAHAFYSEALHMPELTWREIEFWPTVLYSKAEKAMNELKETIALG